VWLEKRLVPGIWDVLLAGGDSDDACWLRAARQPAPGAGGRSHIFCVDQPDLHLAPWVARFSRHADAVTAAARLAVDQFSLEAQTTLGARASSQAMAG
jgi:hypothetical protein